MDVRLLKYALRKNADRNVYIGSGEKARNLPRSPLAMPYELRQLNWKDDAERNEKIAQYKVWLWGVMKNPTHPKHAAVWTELRKLRDDSILLCYCYPKNCHGHVIVAAWKWAVAQGKIDAPRSEPPLQQTMNKAVDEERMVDQARANVKDLNPPVHKDLGPDPAYGPLDMQSILRELGKQYTVLADAKLDEELLETHAIDCEHCINLSPEHPVEDTLMADDVITPAPPQPRKTVRALASRRRTAARRSAGTQRPRLSFDEPRSLAWNAYDDMTADLAEMEPCIDPARMSPGLRAYLALSPAEQEAHDIRFDRAEIAYEAEQLAMNHAA